MPTVKNTINPLHWNGLYGEEAALDRIKGAIDAKLDGASIQMLVRGLHTKSGNPHAFSI
jgi:hypothetical protein